MNVTYYVEQRLSLANHIHFSPGFVIDLHTSGVGELLIQSELYNNLSVYFFITLSAVTTTIGLHYHNILS